MAKSKKAKEKRNGTKRNARLEKAIAAVWGRPRVYDDPKEFDDLCRYYMATLKWNAPSITGICAYLGMSTDTWVRYRNDKKKPLFAQTIEFVELKMVDWLYNCATKQGRGVGAIFLLKNLRPHEYKERGAGSSEDEPIYTKQITGMTISKGK